MSTESPPDKVAEIVGRGYRGWEYYADPRSLTRQLFDLAPAGKPAIDYIDVSTGEFITVSGEGIQDYTCNLSANVSVGPVTTFIKSLTVNFGSDSISKSTSKFGSVINRIAYGRASLLNPRLTADAAHDLESMDPTMLLETYGTHYVRSAILGGRLSFSSSFDSSETTDNVSAKIVCDIGEQYLKAGHVEVGPSKDEAYKKNVLRRATLVTTGGDPSLGGLQLADLDESGIKSPKFEAWSKSIKDRLTIADFDAGGLVPIYELIKNEARRMQVKAVWTEFLKTKSALPVVSLPGDPLRYGDPFFLKSDDNQYFSAAEKMSTTGWAAAVVAPAFIDAYEYYPTLRAGSPTRLSLSKPDDSAAGTPVGNGEFANLLTSESLTGALGGFGPAYNRLGAWGDDWFVYYYRAGSKLGGQYDQEQWSIQRVDGTPNGQLRYGDRVRLISKAYPDQCLSSAGSSQRRSGFTFLTTKPTATSVWTIIRP